MKQTLRRVDRGGRGEFVLADRGLLRWLIGASLAWFLFDFTSYGNTISSPLIIKLVAPHSSLIGQTAYTLLIFTAAAVAGYLLAAWTIDRIGRRRLQTSQSPSSASGASLLRRRRSLLSSCSSA
jgi:MFS family permease